MGRKLKFSGKNGKSYMFEVFQKNQEFNNVVALYSFLAKRQDGYYILYIGKTTELGDRIKNHEKWPKVNRRGCTHIAVCTETSRLTLATDEENLIGNYNPPCNEQLTSK